MISAGFISYSNLCCARTDAWEVLCCNNVAPIDNYQDWKMGKDKGIRNSSGHGGIVALDKMQ